MARSAQIDETRVLQAALSVFWWLGYEATPVIDLGVKMRLNRTRIYELFSSKHRLFILTLRYYQQELHRQLSAVSAEASETVPVRVRQVLELIPHIPTVHPLPPGCFLVKAGSELLPQDAEVQAIVALVKSLVQKLIGGLGSGWLSVGVDDHFTVA